MFFRLAAKQTATGRITRRQLAGAIGVAALLSVLVPWVIAWGAGPSLPHRKFWNAHPLSADRYVHVVGSRSSVGSLYVFGAERGELSPELLDELASTFRAPRERPPSWGPLSEMLEGRLIDPMSFVRVQRSYGWPCESLAWWSLNNLASPRTYSWAWRPTWLREWGSGAAFPLRPLWPGFAVNFAPYWVVGLAVARVVHGVRRARRIRRARCPQCGYSRAGLPAAAVCPECGAGDMSKSLPSAAATSAGEGGGAGV